MPTHAIRLTDSEARKIPVPASGYALHWCPRTPGLALRVTANAARAWVHEQRVDGKTKRRTLGPAAGRGAISADAARKLMLTVAGELANGIDRLEAKREQAAIERAEGVTFADALREYVQGKRRAKDGLALKERTKRDYLAMLDGPNLMKSGAPTLGGGLHTLADTPLPRITAQTIRDLHKSLGPRGVRQQTYCMQVLRAVLRHHGASIESNPLATTTAGKDRITLAPTRGNPTPIPSELLGAWWRAACAIDTPSAEMLRFMLLTGCRPGEAAGIVPRQVDITTGRIMLTDTKNRLDHVVLLSKQALAIVERAAAGKRVAEPLFGVIDAGKTLATINAASGVSAAISQHKLRHTFASIAAQLVPVYTLRRLLNHVGGSDVTGTAYVNVSDTQLRTAWQQVADFIEAAPTSSSR